MNEEQRRRAAAERRRARARKQRNRRIALTMLLVVLVAGLSIGGTIAWLTDTTDEVKNTFTTSDIDITLTETKGGENKQFKMVPGYTIAKDPKVTVEAGSEDCWLFVKIDESTTPVLGDYIDYTVATGWTKGDGTYIPANVYYREVMGVPATGDGVSFDVLTGNAVTVKDTVNKDMMESLNEAGAKKPTLTFTAYASQLMKNSTDKFTAAEAWTNLGQ